MFLMKSTKIYAMFVILMLSVGGIFLSSITSNAHGQGKPSLIPKSGNDSPQVNEIPQNKDSTAALLKSGSGGSGAGTLGCMEGTGGNTGKECIPCDPGLGFPGCIPPDGTFGGSKTAGAA